MKKPILIAVVSALLLTLACVTVNVYFPAAEVQSAADKIVGEVRGAEPPSAEPEAAPQESMLRRSLRSIMLFEHLVEAA